MTAMRLMIGAFTQVTDRMRVSDPTNDKDVWCTCCMDRVAKGAWFAEVVLTSMDKGAVRVSQLIVSHKDANDHALIDDPPQEVGIDSGLLVVCDDQFYANGAILPRTMCRPSISDRPKVTSRDVWNAVCSRLTRSAHQAGLLPNGAVTRTANGSGCYPVVSSRDELGRLRRVMDSFDANVPDDEGSSSD